jgi:hypothetical protein
MRRSSPRSPAQPVMAGRTHCPATPRTDLHCTDQYYPDLPCTAFSFTWPRGASARPAPDEAPSGTPSPPGKARPVRGIHSRRALPPTRAAPLTGPGPQPVPAGRCSPCPALLPARLPARLPVRPCVRLRVHLSFSTLSRNSQRPRLPGGHDRRPVPGPPCVDRFSTQLAGPGAR